MELLNIITGPTNTGKTRFIDEHALRYYSDSIIKLVNSTTRDLRPEEKHGKDYYKYDHDGFNHLITNDLLLEWEEVYNGDLYGCERSEWQRVLATGKIPIVSLNTNGALKFMGKIQNGFIDMTGIEVNAFFITSSREELIERLLEANRKGERKDSPQKIQERIDNIDFELSQAQYFKPENVFLNKNENFDIMANALINKIIYN